MTDRVGWLVAPGSYDWPGGAAQCRVFFMIPEDFCHMQHKILRDHESQALTGLLAVLLGPVGLTGPVVRHGDDSAPAPVAERR
jgi:hypothetical protein